MYSNMSLYSIAETSACIFYRLGLRDRGETQDQVADRIGVKPANIKQHEGLMGQINAEMRPHILDALCADALYVEGKEITTTKLYNKLRDDYRIKSITPKGNRWYIEF